MANRLCERKLTEVHAVFMVPLQKAEEQVSEMGRGFSGNAGEKNKNTHRGSEGESKEARVCRSRQTGVTNNNIVSVRGRRNVIVQ